MFLYFFIVYYYFYFIFVLMFNLLILFFMKRFNLFMHQFTYCNDTLNNVFFLFAVSFIVVTFLAVLIHFIFMDWANLSIY